MGGEASMAATQWEEETGIHSGSSVTTGVSDFQFSCLNRALCLALNPVLSYLDFMF